MSSCVHDRYYLFISMFDRLFKGYAEFGANCDYSTAFESSRPYPDPQYPYPGQSFATQPTETAGVNVAAVHLNNLSFASNGAANQYLPSVVPTVTSYQPTSGTSGTKISIKFTAPYDLMEMTNQVFLGFGSHRSPVHAMRDSADESGFGYVASGVAPELEDTGSAGSNVPMTILGENTERHSVLSMVVGTFTYHDPQTLGEEGPYESITRRPSVKSPEEEHHQHHRGTPPRHPQMKQEMKQEGDQLSEAAGAATNTYPYASTTHQAVASHYEVAGYSNSNTTNTNNTSNNSNNNGNNNTNTMISTYHRPSYAADYPRPPSLLKGSWGSPYGPSLVSPRSPPSIHHTITRSAVTAPPAPSPSTPRLERTTTMQASAGSGGGGGSLTPHVLYATKAMLKMNGDLKAMASDWTAEELQVGRRLVLFHKRQRGSTVSLSFNAVAPADRPPNGICVSCIYWKEKRECYVTSVDTIALLEQLIYAPNRFNVDEKNRIRRNIEGLKPTTVSKAKRDTEDFFKVIMGFGNPKPRNIEKDIKVFPWKALEKALTKIVSKYVSPRCFLWLSPPLLNYLVPSFTTVSPSLPLNDSPFPATDPCLRQGLRFPFPPFKNDRKTHYSPPHYSSKQTK